MRIPVVIISLALALAGCLKVPESDNTGLLLPLAAPDTGSAAYSCSAATPVLTVGAGYACSTITGGATQTFSFATEPYAVYSIHWDEGTASAANTLNVKVTALAADQSTLLHEQAGTVAFDQIDSSNSPRVVQAGAAGGTYYLSVSPVTTGASGQYAIRIDKVSRPISVGAIFSSDTLVSSDAYVRYFSFSASTSTTYSVKWGDSYQGPGGLRQDVVVSLGRLSPNTAATWAFTSIDSGWNAPRTYTPSSAGMTYIAVKRYSSSATTQTPPGFRIEVY